MTPIIQDALSPNDIALILAQAAVVKDANVDPELQSTRAQIPSRPMKETNVTEVRASIKK